MQDEVTVQEIEVSIEAAREQIEIGKALERLRENLDWQLLIDGEYLTRTPARLATLINHPAYVGDPKKTEQVMADFKGVGAFAEFLRSVEFATIQAHNALADGEETLALMSQEDGEE